MIRKTHIELINSLVEEQPHFEHGHINNELSTFSFGSNELIQTYMKLENENISSKVCIGGRRHF